MGGGARGCWGVLGAIRTLVEPGELGGAGRPQGQGEAWSQERWIACLAFQRRGEPVDAHEADLGCGCSKGERLGLE